MVRRKETPNVWVQDLTEHTPAHRVVDPDHYFTDDRKPVDPPPAFFRIACPPGIMTGGQIISRAQAAAIKVYPCCRCFNLPATGGTR